MATRVVVPATTFALGAASQRQFGYVDVALDYARRSDPSVASHVDAMFGRASDSARTVADAVTRAPSASASDGARVTASALSLIHISEPTRPY